MPQLMRFRHIGDIGWRTDRAVHQAALGIDPNMAPNAEVPLVPFPGLVQRNSRLLVPESPEGYEAEKYPLSFKNIESRELSEAIPRIPVAVPRRV
jgi:hypothetical protein